MSRWTKLRKKLIENSLQPKEEILSEEIQSGRVHGAIFYKKGTNPKRGILLVHGIGSNRYNLKVLAQRLASFGFFCLSIDMPSHYLNVRPFSLGELSETVIEGVSLLRNSYGMQRIAVIGHSIGAAGVLFSNAGYTCEIENQVYSLWDQIIDLTEKKLEATRVNAYTLELEVEIEKKYTQLKEIILYSLKRAMEYNAGVSCYVLLAMPTDLKKALPLGLPLMRLLKPSLAKRAFEALSHNRTMQRYERENRPLGQIPPTDADHVSQFLLKTKEFREFVDYLLTMKEPLDFLKLIEVMADFKHKDRYTNFFEYYQKKYLMPAPKLFVYGKRDWHLKPFFWFKRKRIEDAYKSFGNAQIYYGEFAHVISEDPREYLNFFAATNTEVTRLIMKFLDKNV